MDTAKRLAITSYHHLVHDSLRRNSVYLILSSFFSALLGTFFWAVSAHTYSADKIGIVVTLVSVLGFLGTFSLLGVTNTFIRYLPDSKERESLVGTAFIVTTAFGIVSALATVVLLLLFEPKTAVLLTSINGITFFLIYAITNIFGSLLDAIFITYRRTGYYLLRNTFGSMLRIVLVLLFVRYNGAGLFSAISLSVGISSILGFYFVSRKIKLRIHYSFNSSILNWAGFSLANYVSGLTSSLVLAVVPLLVLRDLGAKSAAYYFIAYTISSGLRFIPQGITQSLFAEGSSKIKHLKSHTFKAIKLLATLMLPASIFLFLVAKYVLLIFGKNYSSGASSCLHILILVSLLSSVNYLGDTILNTTRRMRMYMATNIYSALSTLVFIAPLLRFGLSGVAWGWFLSEFSVVLIYVWLFKTSVIKAALGFTKRGLHASS